MLKEISKKQLRFKEISKTKFEPKQLPTHFVLKQSKILKN